MTRYLLAAFLAVAAPAIALSPVPAYAQSKAERPAANQVRLSLLVVHATDSESGVDPALGKLAKSFSHFKYKGYRLLAQHDADVRVNQDQSFSIEGGRTVLLTVLSKEDSDARVRVQVTGKGGKILDTTVKVNRDGTFIVAGPQYKDGILMLPLKASY
jgi:hypothetical protein